MFCMNWHNRHTPCWAVKFCSDCRIWSRSVLCWATIFSISRTRLSAFILDMAGGGCCFGGCCCIFGAFQLLFAKLFVIGCIDAVGPVDCCFNTAEAMVSIKVSSRIEFHGCRMTYVLVPMPLSTDSIDSNRRHTENWIADSLVAYVLWYSQIPVHCGLRIRPICQWYYAVQHLCWTNKNRIEIVYHFSTLKMPHLTFRRLIWCMHRQMARNESLNKPFGAVGVSISRFRSIAPTQLVSVENVVNSILLEYIFVEQQHGVACVFCKYFYNIFRLFVPTKA